MTGLSVTGQQDFSGGMFEGPSSERIPPNGSYDVINGLFDQDQGVVYRRGGGAYKASSDLAQPILSVWDGYLVGGQRTVMVQSGFPTVAVLDSDDATVVLPGQDSYLGSISNATFLASAFTNPLRGVGLHGMVFWPVPKLPMFLCYAGARKTAAYNTGTVDVTNGSATVTGHSTLFAGAVEPGMFLRVGATSRAILTVDSNTQLTLRDPWDSTTAAGTAYSADSVKHVTGTGMADIGTAATDGAVYLAAVGQRLVYAQNTRIHFSSSSDVFSFAATDYHELPAGARIIGLDSTRDVCLVFTTAGVWAISNMDYNLTDPYGNPQQRLDRISQDIVLWGDPGIAGWRDSIVAPAVDDIYFVNSAGGQPGLSRAIRTLYQGYVKAGYSPGVASVYRGHYFLPILNGTSWVDTLVCDLETVAWSRWSGFSARATGFARRVGDSTRAAGLMTAVGARLLDLGGAFVPSSANKSEADGSTHAFSVTTRDYATGSNKSNLVKKARLRFEGTSAAGSPTLGLSVASGPVTAAYTALSTTDGSTPGASAGTQTVPFSANWADRFVRFKIATTDAWDSLKIKGLELFIRPKGRQ